MQRRSVGHSGLQVSRLGLGTLTWGRETRLEDARPLLRSFVAAGGSLVDTAAAYAAGDAERMIGRMLRAGDVQREEIVAKGDLVTIVYEAPGLLITLRGRANEAGAMGDVVSVTNPQSKRVLQGKVTGAGRISVQPSTAGRVASAQ